LTTALAIGSDPSPQRRPFARMADLPVPLHARMLPMFASVLIYYFLLKITFFFGLVRIQVKFDTMKDHWLFLGILYTAGVAFLSFVYLFSWQEFQWPALYRNIARNFGITPTQFFLAGTFILSTVYFWLLSKFDEGVIFWTLLLLGLAVVWF
jgi:hypothetical protein